MIALLKTTEMHQPFIMDSGWSLQNPDMIIWDFLLNFEFHRTFLQIKSTGHQSFGPEEEVRMQEKQLRELKRCGYCLCRWKGDANRNMGLKKTVKAMRWTFQPTFPQKHSPEDTLTEPSETHVRLLTARM